MGLNSLRELVMSGVKWELAEQSSKCKVQSADGDKEETAKKNPNFEPCTLNSDIVPPSAPIGIDAATRALDGVDSLASLLSAISEFNHPLKQFVKNVVPPHFGNNGNELLIITDMPSTDDDASGQILTNSVGELMDKMLSAIGFTRDMVSIVPLIFWRTPGGRTPAQIELDLARPFVDRAISLLKPRAILTLGTLTAAQIVDAKLPKHHGEILELKVESLGLRQSSTETSSDISKDASAGATLNSKLSTLNSDFIPVIPIYHPNFLMLKPDAKRDAWNALQKLQNLLKNQ